MADSRIMAVVLSTIWLLFLAYPATSLLTGDYAVWQKVLGLTLIAAFAIAYVGLFAVIHRSDDVFYRLNRRVVVVMGVMLALAVGIVLILGITALGLTSYFIAGGMFAFPRLYAVLVPVSALVISAAVPLATGTFGEWGFMSLINAGVLVGTGIARFYAETADAQNVLDTQRVVVEERERVARDVHDVLGHSLTVIALKSELAERLIDVDAERAKGELQEINALAREAISEVRATVGGLRVRQLSEEFQSSAAALAEAGIDLTVEGSAEDVDPRYRILFAWALREATTNILRHSGAQRVRLELGSRCVAIEDDGRGLGDAAEGHGLRGLRERVEDVGGTLTVGPAQGFGDAVVRPPSTEAGRPNIQNPDVSPATIPTPRSTEHHAPRPNAASHPAPRDGGRPNIQNSDVSPATIEPERHGTRLEVRM